MNSAPCSALREPDPGSTPNDIGTSRGVAEVNNSGDMVGGTLRMIDPNVAFTAVRASRGKVVRAEPVAALYQQGRAHHIGTFPQLEDQMTNSTSDIDRAVPTRPNVSLSTT
jgi:phage terminase large subunit-like protein